MVRDVKFVSKFNVFYLKLLRIITFAVYTMNKRTKIISSLLVLSICLLIIGYVITVYVNEHRVVDFVLIISVLLTLIVAVLNIFKARSEQ